MTATATTCGDQLEVVTIVEHGLDCAGCDDPLEPGATAVRSGAVAYFHDDTACMTLDGTSPVRAGTSPGRKVEGLALD